MEKLVTTDSYQKSLAVYIAIYLLVLFLITCVNIFIATNSMKISVLVESVIFPTLTVILLFARSHERFLSSKEIANFCLKLFVILLTLFLILLAVFLIYLFYFSNWIVGTLIGLGFIFVGFVLVSLLMAVFAIPVLTFICLSIYKNLVERSITLQNGLKKISLISFAIFAVCLFF